MLKKERIMVSGLLMACFVCALLVVVNTWHYRTLVAQKKVNEVKTDQLNSRWSQLVLEKQALSTPAKIEESASRQLGMVSPSKEQVRYLVLQK